MLSVNIPAGIESGMRLRLANEGEPGDNGGPPGDLYVAVTVQPHDIFSRKGNDILCDIPVSFVTATLGGKVEVPTLKGTTVIKVPAGTQQDKAFRLKGLGVPSLKGQQTGDQIMKVKIQIPTKLTAAQKTLLTEFAKESGMTMDQDGDGFFDKMKTYFE
jgi:molecular chaperone DnaJ